MPRNYVPKSERKPGQQIRPNGTAVKRATASDFERAVREPQRAPAGEGEGTGGGAPAGEPEGTGQPAGTGEGTVFLDPRAGTREDTGERKKFTPGKTAGPASTSTSPKKKVSTSLEGIEGLLLSIHMMGATLLKVPELNMSEPEAKKLAQAIAHVASFYDVGASEKTMAWVQLAVVAGGVYGTRAYAYHLRLQVELQAKRQLPPAANPPRPNVVQPFTAPLYEQAAAG